MSAGHDDYAVEPIRGLPEVPPEGERILWQGSPSWWGLAKNVFHIRGVAAYFALLMAWRGSVHLHDAGHGAAAALAALSLLPVSLFGLGLLALLAWLSARTSVYTITSRRVVLRVGVALPTAINIPFVLVESGSLALGAGGVGDIPLALSGEDRVPYTTLWPHARPWRFSKPQPMLRSVPDAQKVAALLSDALLAAQPLGTANSLPARETKAARSTTSGMPSPAGMPA